MCSDGHGSGDSTNYYTLSRRTGVAVLPLATDSWDELEYAAIERVVRSRHFTMGAEVAAFEAEFAARFGSRFAVMVNSGSSANLLAVAGLVYHPDTLLKPGDTVLVPAVSWSTTYFPLHQYGLKLRFVDVDLNSLNIDCDLLEEAITPSVRGIFAVNLLGNPCELDRIQTLCERHDLVLIEDNCESMGARLHGKMAGSFGHVGTFSTFYSHHISTMEGGVIITDDERLYHTMISLRSHGWLREQPPHSHLRHEVDPFMARFRFVLPGYNLRPLEMSGAIGREQIRKLPSLVRARRENANFFLETFGDRADVLVQRETGESSWFGFSFVLRGTLSGKRKELVSRLETNGIECRPIVAGNFTNNPVIQYIDHEISHPLRNAEEIDANGLFIGNQHYPIEGALMKVEDVMDHI